MSTHGYVVDTSSSTWLAIKAEADNIKRTLEAELVTYSVDPRRADQIRGEINGIKRILAIGSEPEQIEVIELAPY